MIAIPVLYSFARSGGTLVNQLLGVHPQCLVLSEVSPAASFKPIGEQAADWLHLIQRDEMAEFSRLAYREKIARLNTLAAQRGKRLVVRDWVTVNFLPGAARDHTVPSRQLEQELYLADAGLESTPLVVTRRAAAVLRSIRGHFAHLRDLDAGVFADAYLAFAHAVAPFPRVHLEDLRASPGDALRRILERFELDDSEPQALLGRFHEFTNCTGNTTLGTANESATARSVLPPETLAEDDLALSRAQPALQEADRILGYV